MPTIAEVFANAIQHHQAGRLQAAEQIYCQILASDPNQADALHLLGVIALQLGKYETAVESIRRAIELKGNEPAFHSNLANVFKAQGKLDQAIDSYRRAIELKPDHAVAHYNLGSAFQCQGDMDQAAACFRTAVALKPDYAAAHNNLGSALAALGKSDTAIASFHRALELTPDYAEAHFNLGTAFQAERKLDEAIASFRRALELKPDLQEAYANLGNAFQARGNLDEAIACHRRALERKPDNPIAHSNLGSCFQAQGNLDAAVASFRRALELTPNYAEARYNLGTAFQAQDKLDEAAASFGRALELKPDLAAAHYNLGTVYQDQSKLDAAIASFHRALELEPDYAEAHSNLSLALLQQGDFERGWSEYHWRWKCAEFRAGALQGPPWSASTAGGTKTVLLHTDQGFGDTLQFVRYAPLVKQHGGDVFLRCPKKLIPLLSRCPGIDGLFSHEATLPGCDAEAYLTRLPMEFHTTLETVPRNVPYLFADPELVEQWRSRLPAGGLRVGIAWQGNPEFRHDKTRSIPLLDFAPLADIPGVRLISLQKGHGAEQMSGVTDRFHITELALDRDESAGAFMETAAVMMNLDLVITSDTSIAHLAGGLGVPVWVALSFVAEWRWLLDRSDSPWYPTMRLFRQTNPGNWPGLFEQMKVALSDRPTRPYTN